MKDYYKAYDERYKICHSNNILWETPKPSLLIEEIIKEYNINKNSDILDLGCGEGRDAINLLDKGYNVTAIDYSCEAIRMCNKLTNNKYKAKFISLDIMKEKFDKKFNFIYSISLLHMFVTNDHRNMFYKFIKEHLNNDGICLVTVLGDGHKEYSSNIEDAFKIVDRLNININDNIQVTNTSCRILNWDNLINEVEINGFIILKKWLSYDIPGFNESMCILIKKR